VDVVTTELEQRALDTLEHAERVGVGVFVQQASDFAPKGDREQDTVVVILRGQYARSGREALTAVADVIRERP